MHSSVNYDMQSRGTGIGYDNLEVFPFHIVLLKLGSLYDLMRRRGERCVMVYDD